MKISTNDRVRVKLTPFGRRMHRKNWGVSLDYVAPRVDADGYSEFQLWSLMAIFGPGMFHGMPEMPFEDNAIELVEPQN